MNKAESLEDILDVICVENPLSSLGGFWFGQGMPVERKSNLVADLRLTMTGS